MDESFHTEESMVQHYKALRTQYTQQLFSYRAYNYPYTALPFQT